MNRSTQKILLFICGIILSCNTFAANPAKKFATTKQLAAEAAARIRADQTMQAALSGIALMPGPQGSPGIQGQTGIVATFSFAGQMPNIPFGETSFMLRGPTALVTISTAQRLTATVTAVLGTSSGTATFDYHLCYQSVTSGSPIQFNPGGVQAFWLTATATPTFSTFTTSQSVIPGVAGDYLVGMCIRNNSNPATDINNNDWVHGWVQVTN